ncbi:MAG: TIGR00282 family metallophosphoesterase [candidate division KSB1 bacterium]|nr:TIGR00282 family metallophosphoesterase [candidate division KSB1 bacterium]
MPQFQNKKNIKILFIADIIGNPGLSIIKSTVKSLRDKYQIDFCIANGENGAAGKGLTENIAQQYFSNGIDVITTGNHIFERYGFQKLLNTNQHRIIRPLNYPFGASGRGSIIADIAPGIKIGVINIQGRTFMYPIDCPFRTVKEEIHKIRQVTPIIIVDFHAEATAEKRAMGWYLDGKVSAVIGTHTHVQTSDETILNHGTAYITDVGMTGPYDSVIGMKKDIAIKRFIQQLPERYQPADSDLRFAGVIVTIDVFTGKAENIERLFFPLTTS